MPLEDARLKGRVPGKMLIKLPDSNQAGLGSDPEGLGTLGCLWGAAVSSGLMFSGVGTGGLGSVTPITGWVVPAGSQDLSDLEFPPSFPPFLSSSFPPSLLPSFLSCFLFYSLQKSPITSKQTRGDGLSCPTPCACPPSPGPSSAGFLPGFSPPVHTCVDAGVRVRLFLPRTCVFTFYRGLGDLSGPLHIWPLHSFWQLYNISY